jgi:hypothetical protein
LKSDEADKYFSVPAIEFGSGRDEAKKQTGVHFVVEHGEMAPFRGEEDSITHRVRMVEPGDRIRRAAKARYGS